MTHRFRIRHATSLSCPALSSPAVAATAFVLAVLTSFASAASSAQASAAPPTPNAFTWTQSVQTTNGDALQRIELPAAVYAGAARRDLGDLRIFNAAGEVVPHALVRDAVASTEPATQSIAVRHFTLTAAGTTATPDAVAINVRRQADGSLVEVRLQPGTATKTRPVGIVVDASAVKQPLVGLTLAWTARTDGTVAAVDVDTSDDLQTWRPAVRAAQLVDLRMGEEHLRRDRIELGSLRAKYLRLIWPADQEPLAITDVVALTQTRESPASAWRWTEPIVAYTGGAGEFLFESNGLPVDALRIELPQTNTVAPLHLFRRADAKQGWRDAASTVAFRIQRNGQEVRSPDIGVARSSDAFWRVQVDPRSGGLGAGEFRVRLAWQPQTLVFVARGPGPFTLAYGKADLSPSPFDIATLMPGYAPGQVTQLPEASVGPAQAAAQPVQATAQRTLDWRRIGLWAILIVGVAALGAMAWRLMASQSGRDDARSR